MLEELAGGVVLTHGAGANCDAPLLVAIGSALTAEGYLVRRFNLAFRQRRAKGPPHPSGAAADRESLREAATEMRMMARGPLILAGHSYGGRQASMLAAEDATVADFLLLLSYPLHPPLKPAQARTAHFPNLRVPCLFVHGTADGFATIDEMKDALRLIAAPTQLSVVERAGHDLARGRFDLQTAITNKLPRANSGM
jgi:predicted alpha/beta-hydrolase family hydrolase